MTDRVLFLGTSHGDPSLERYSSSSVLEFCGRRFLVDAGEPALASLIRHHISVTADIDAVFITHVHEDHAGGLTGILKQLVKRPPAHMPPVYLPEAAAIPPLVAWLRAMHNAHLELLDLRVSEPAETLHFGEVTVQFIPTRHLEPVGGQSMAILFSGSGRRVLFTGDLRADYTDFPLKPDDPAVDLAVAEVCHAWCCSAEDAKKNSASMFSVLSSRPVRRLVFNHIGPHWTDGKEPELAALLAASHITAELAADDLSLEF